MWEGVITVKQVKCLFTHKRAVSIALSFALLLAFLPLTLNPTPSRAATGVNPQLNFQARLYTVAGATVADGTYNMRFKVYQDGNGVLGGGDETLKWTEERKQTNRVTVTNGFFSVYLGSVCAFADGGCQSNGGIDWNQDTLWLSLDIGGTADTPTPTYDGEMSPFKRLGSTPYAFNSDLLDGLTAASFVQLAQGVQTDSSAANPSIFINKTGVTANILQLQRGGADVLVIDNAGALTLKPQTNSTEALKVQNAAGTAIVLDVDTTNQRVVVGNPATTGGGDPAVGVFNVGNTANSTLLQLNGQISTPYFSVGTRQNHILRSEEFDNASWVKSNMNTVTANSATAPNAAATAENMSGTTGAGQVSQASSSNATSGDWTFSVWLKMQSGTGTVQLRVDSSTPSTGTAKTVNLTTSWQRYSVTESVAAGSTTKTAVLITGTTAIAAWGAQLEPGSGASASVNTTSSAVTSANTTFSVRQVAQFDSTVTVFGLIGARSDNITTTSTDRIAIDNQTSATAGVPVQISPRLRFSGRVWDTGAAASRTSNFKVENIPVSGNPTSANLTFAYDLNAGGYSNVLTLSSAGALTATAGVQGTTGNFTAGSSLTLGTASTNTGAILFKNGSNANTLTLNTGATAADYTLTLPTSAGSANDCLQNTGTAGILTFADCNLGLSLQTAYNGGNSIAVIGTNPVAISNAITSTPPDSLTVTHTATSGTIGSGFLFTQNGSGGTTTNAIRVLQSAGTLTNGILFEGTIGTDITTATNRNLLVETNGTGQLNLDSGTTGAINIGVDASNAKTITLGSNSVASSVVLNGTAGVTVATLSGTTGATFVCRNASSILASCTNTPATSLQTAYDGGNSIAIAGTNPVAITNAVTSTPPDSLTVTNTATSGTITNALLVHENGTGGTTTNALHIQRTAGTLTNGILFTGTIGTDITTATNRALTVVANGTGALTLTGGASSTWSIGGTNQNLTLQTSGTGTVFVQPAGAGTVAIANAGVSTQTVNICKTGSTANTCTANIGTSTGAAQTVTVGSTATSSATRIDAGSGNLIVNTTAGTLTLQTTTSGNINVTPGGTGDVVVTLDSDSNLQATGGLTSLTGATSGSADTFNVSNSTSTGNIAVFKDNSTAVFTLQNGGNALFQNQTNSTTAFQILNAASTTTLFNADTTNGYVGLGTASPTERLHVVGNINQPYSGPAFTSGLSLADTNTRGVAVSGNYAYVTKGHNSGTCSGTTITGCEFSVIDVSTPASPAAVIGIDLNPTGTSTANQVVISGNYAYVVKDANVGTCTSGTTHTGCEFIVIDISTPTSPSVVAGIDLPGSDSSGVSVSGSYAYVSRGLNAGTCTSGTTHTGCELVIINVSTPTSPSATGGMSFTNYASTAQTSGTYTYIGKGLDAGTCSGATITGCEFAVIDVSTPSSPTAVSGLNLADNAGNDIKLSGSYAYMVKENNTGICTSGTTHTGCEFLTINISAPSTPTIAGGTDLGSYPNRLYLANNFAYIGKATTGGTCSATNAAACQFAIVDVSSTTNPSYVGGLNLSVDGYGLFVLGNYAYLTKDLSAGTCSGTTTTGCEFTIAEVSGVTRSTVGYLKVVDNLSVDAGISAAGGYSNAGITGLTIDCPSNQTLNNIDVSGGIVTAGTCTANAADIAELYASTESLEPGDVVAADPSVSLFPNVKKTTAPYQQNTLGIVSTKPHTTLQDEDNDHEQDYPIALIGRVPTKVNLEGGPILPGDYITASSTPGYGMKATREGQVVGVALEAYDGTALNQKIRVFVDPGWHAPSIANDLQGSITLFSELNISGLATINNLTVTGIATFENVVIQGHIVGNADTRGEIVIPAGQTSATFTFNTPYATKPYVVVSPMNNAVLFKADATVTGITVTIQSAASEDTHFSYMIQQ